MTGGIGSSCFVTFVDETGTSETKTAVLQECAGEAVAPSVEF